MFIRKSGHPSIRRRLPNLLLSHQKTTIRFTCSHPLTSNCLLSRSLNHCHTLIPGHTQSVLHSKPLTSTLPRALVHRVHAFYLFPFPLCLTDLASVGKKNNVYARGLQVRSIFKDLNFQLPFNFHFFPSLFFSISIPFSNMTSSSKDRYFGNVAKSRRSSPGESQNSVFFQGQGGRTVLPPLSDSFPTLRFPGLFFT